MLFYLIIILIIIYRAGINYLPQLLKKYDIEIVKLNPSLTFQELEVNQQIQEFGLNSFFLKIQQFCWGFKNFRFQFRIKKVEVQLKTDLYEMQLYNVLSDQKTQENIILENVEILKQFLTKNWNFLIENKSQQKSKNESNITSQEARGLKQIISNLFSQENQQQDFEKMFNPKGIKLEKQQSKTLKSKSQNQISTAEESIGIFRICLNFIIRIIIIFIFKNITILIEEIEFIMTEEHKIDDSKESIKVQIKNLSIDFNYFKNENFQINPIIDLLTFQLFPNSQYKNLQSELSLFNINFDLQIPGSHNLIHSVLNSKAIITIGDIIGIVNSQGLQKAIGIPLKCLLLKKIKKIVQVDQQIFDYDKIFDYQELDFDDFPDVIQKASIINRNQFIKYPTISILSKYEGDIINPRQHQMILVINIDQLNIKHTCIPELFLYSDHIEITYSEKIFKVIKDLKFESYENVKIQSEQILFGMNDAIQIFTYFGLGFANINGSYNIKTYLNFLPYLIKQELNNDQRHILKQNQFKPFKQVIESINMNVNSILIYLSHKKQRFSAVVKDFNFTMNQNEFENFEKVNVRIKSFTLYNVKEKKNIKKIMLIESFELLIKEQDDEKSLSVDINKTQIQIQFLVLQKLIKEIFKFVIFFKNKEIVTAKNMSKIISNEKPLEKNQQLKIILDNNSKTRINISNIQIKLNFEFLYDIVINVESIQKASLFKIHNTYIQEVIIYNVNIDYIDSKIHNILCLDEFQVNSQFILYDKQYKILNCEKFQENFDLIHDFYKKSIFLVKSIKIIIPFKFKKIKDQIVSLVQFIIQQVEEMKLHTQIDTQKFFIEEEDEILLKVDKVQIYYVNQPQNKALQSLLVTFSKRKKQSDEQEIIDELLLKSKNNNYQTTIEIHNFQFEMKKYFQNQLTKKEDLIQKLKSAKFFENIKNLNDIKFVMTQSMYISLSLLTLKFYDLPYYIVDINKLDIEIKILKVHLKTQIKFDKDMEQYAIQNFIDLNTNLKKIKAKLGLNIMSSLIHFIKQIQENVSDENDQEQNQKPQNSTTSFGQQQQNLKQSTNQNNYNISDQDLDNQLLGNKLKIKQFPKRKSVTQTDIQYVQKEQLTKEFDQNHTEKQRKQNQEMNQQIDLLRFTYNFYIKGKISKISFHLLNSTQPYKQDALIIKLPKLNFLLHKKYLNITLKQFIIKNKIQHKDDNKNKKNEEEGDLIKFPCIEVVIKLVLNNITDFNIQDFKFLKSFSNFKEQQKIQNFSIKLFVNIPQDLKEPPILNLKLETLNYLITLDNMKKDFLMKNLMQIISTKNNSNLEDSDPTNIKYQKEYTNYLKVIQGWMNYNLNESQEFYEKCEKIEIKLCLNSLKILFFQNEAISFQDKVFKQNQQIQGFEIIMDLISFKTKIEKQKLEISDLEIFKTNKAIMVWKVTQYEGQIDFFYGSFYQKDQIQYLKPELLYEKRKQQFDSSIKDPYKFAEFFEFKLNENLKKVKFSDNIVNSLMKNFDIKKQIKEGIINEKKQTIDEFNLGDLDFLYNKVFFKINRIKMKSNEKLYIQRKINQLPKLIQDLQKARFKNVFEIFGFKLVFSDIIKIVIENMVEKIIKNLKRSVIKEFNESNDNEKQKQDIIPEINIQDYFNLLSGKKELTQKKLEIGFTINGMELNIYDQNSDTQILLGSQEQTYGIMFNEILNNDFSHFDPKINLEIFCNKMQLFTTPSKSDALNRAIWMEDGDTNKNQIYEKFKDNEFSRNQKENDFQIRQGSLNKIFQTSQVQFHFHFFQKKSCFYDFTKDENNNKNKYPEYWNKEKRNENLFIKVTQIDAFFDTLSVSKFALLINFFMKLVNNPEEEQKNEEFKKRMYNELVFFGHSTIQKKLFEESSKIDTENITTFKLKSIFNYQVDKFNLTLLNKIQKAFMRLELTNFQGSTNFNENIFTEVQLTIQNLLIKNLQIKEYDIGHNLIKVKNEKEDFNFMFKIATYEIPGELQQNSWKIFQNFEILVKPIQIYVIDQIFHQIYEFIFDSNLLNNPTKEIDFQYEKQLQQLYLFDPDKYIKGLNSKKVKKIEVKQKEQIMIPDYFRRFKIHQMEFDLSYETSIKLIQLQNASFTFDNYEQQNQLKTIKELMDQYVKILVKKIMLSYIKYKVTIQRIKDKDKDKNKKYQNNQFNL